LDILNLDVVKITVILANCEHWDCLWPYAYHTGFGLCLLLVFARWSFYGCLADWSALLLGSFVGFVSLGVSIAWAVGSLPISLDLFKGFFGFFPKGFFGSFCVIGGDHLMVTMC
jgi:hypothetical protein